MGYHRLLLLPPSPPQRVSLLPSSSFPYARKCAVAAAALADSASSPSVAAAAAAATRRRAVLLVGVSVLPLLRLRDAVATAAQPSTVDIVTDRMDNVNIVGTNPEVPSAERLQSEVKGPLSRNPLADLLNAISVMASGVLAGFLGTSQREKKALQSTISSMEIKLAENETAMSLLRENYEKMLLDGQAEQKKQARMFQEGEATLRDQLASTQRTISSLSQEVQREKELVEQLKHEIHRLESNIAQANEENHVFEGKLREKLETIDILQDKVNLLSQEVIDKDENIRQLSSSLSSKDGDYQNLHLIYNETKESLEHANSKIEQLQNDVFAAKDDLQSKVSSIDSLNEKVQILYTTKSEAEERISELMKKYSDLEAASEMGTSRDSELLLEKDDQLNQLEEKLFVALSDSSKDRALIAELKNQLDASRTVLDNEVKGRQNLLDLVQSTEEALRDSSNEVFKLSEELSEVKRSNQDLIAKISKFSDDSNQVKQSLTNKIAKAESVCRTLSDELASVKGLFQKTQEDLDVTSNQLASTMEAHDELNKELLDVYKKLESATNELVRERKINATLNKELEALVKQSLVDSEARRSLQADLDAATNSLHEVTESTLFMSQKQDATNAKISAINEEKEMVAEALAEQKKSTVEAQQSMADAQNLINRLGAERENFAMRSNKLEEELATAKGEILRMRRHISSNGFDNTKVLETGTTSNSSQPLKRQNMNNLVQNTNSMDDGAPRSSRRIYRRKKDRPAT